MANPEYSYNDSQMMNRIDDDDDDSDSSSVALNQKGKRAGGSNSADNSGAARPPPKKRNRAALSCTLCRERKVKCDRVIPCQQCIKRGDAEYCHLDPNKRGPQGRANSGNNRKHQHQHQHQEVDYNNTANTSQSPSQAYPGLSIPSPSSAAEVDAIKARLAQLEHALASQQGSANGPSPPGFSNQSQYSSGYSPGGVAGQGPSPRLSWQNGSGNNSNTSLTNYGMGGTPANQFAPLAQRSSFDTVSQPLSAASAAAPARLPSFFNPQGSEDGSVGRLPPLGSNGRSSSGNIRNYNMFELNSADNSRRPGNIEPKTTNVPLSSSSFNSSFVKENSVETNRSGGNHARGDVDSDTEDAALVLEGLAMGAGRGGCDGKKAKSEHGNIQDVVENLPTKSIQGYVEEDKAKDIMSEGRYGDASDKKDAAIMIKPPGALPAIGPEHNIECVPIDSDSIAELLKQDPDAEFGPDGKRVPPAQRVCILLSRHENSLFNLVYGPETFLGWGMGWAFAAAEAAGDMMKVSDVVGCKGVLQREAVLRAIIRSLPDEESANHLLDVYASRVKFLAGNCIHLPTFRKEMAAFYALGTVEKRARVTNFVDPGWLSTFLMILVLSLHFHPCERPESVMHFFDGRTVHLWRSAAQTCLVLARYQSSTSMAVLQAIILVNLYLMGIGKKNMSLLNTGITNAYDMGLHRLGAKDKQPKEGENPGITVRREIAKRIWHYLVIGDWCSAPTNGGIYRIQPNQFNTPLPGNYNDEDLNQSPLPPPRPMTEHTDMSFTLQKIAVTIVIRENVDMQFVTKLDNGRLSCSDTGYLDGRYRGLLEQAPSFYRIGSTEGENTNTEIERWLFQQYVFDKLLRLHRPNLSSKAGARTSCVLLARSILDMQRRIRSRCTVVDRLFINLGQSFSAAIVLCLDLLQTPPSAAMRNIVRGEIQEALKALRHVDACNHGTSHNVQVIEALLDEEETRWKQNGERSEGVMRRPSGPTRKRNLLNLALRVAKATRGEEPFKPTGSEGDKSKVDNNGNHSSIPAMSDKDKQSQKLMEQLLVGKSTYDEPSSFSRAPFQTGPQISQAATNFFGADEMDLSFANLGDDGSQSFDLSKFLAECDNKSSPGSVSSGGLGGNYDAVMSSGASDSGHSSLHNGGRANSSSSSGRLSHTSSHQSLQNSGNGGGVHSESHSPVNQFRNVEGTIGNQSGSSVTANTLPAFAPTQGLSPNAPEQSTGLDGFWNWILTQGSMPNAINNQIPEPTAPLGQNNNNNNNQTNAQLQAQSQDIQNSYTQNVSSHFQDLFARTLAGETAVNRKQGEEASIPGAPIYNSTFDGANQVAPQMNNLQGPNNNIISAKNTTSGGDTAAAVLSVGTPSAGMGSSWMSTPGLLDFAYEFGTNDNNVNFANSLTTS